MNPFLTFSFCINSLKQKSTVGSIMKLLVVCAIDVSPFCAVTVFHGDALLLRHLLQMQLHTEKDPA